MRQPTHTGRRLQISRIDLDLRGIAPATAEASARALGPALARALTPWMDARIGSADRIDAGRIDSPASPEVHDLAARIAQRIAHALEREER
jgi:hypothetical protein